MTHDEIEALAQEIATTEGMSIGRALEVAREQLAGLQAYAEAWENWVAAWHDPRIANVRGSLARARAAKPYAGRAWHIRSAEQQLAELEAQHAAGTLGPLVDDGSPF
jgi:hypothetical protein